MRTGRERGREMPEKQKRFRCQPRRGAQEKQELLFITEDWSWEDPVETGSARFRGKESAAQEGSFLDRGSRTAAGPNTCSIHSTPQAERAGR